MKATAHIVQPNNTALFAFMGELKGANCEDMEEHFRVITALHCSFCGHCDLFKFQYS